MSRTSTFPLHDRLLGGTLTDKLRGWRNEGLTLLAIRDRLAEHDVKVSIETVRRWCDDVGATRPEQVAS
jgi:hypothetical protein